MNDVNKGSLFQWAIKSVLFFCLSCASTVGAVPYKVSVDTSLLSGATGQLAFDFVDGGTPSNSTTLSGFSTTGTLGSSSSIGGISGAFPGAVTIQDAALFNEYLVEIAFGASLSFFLDTTKNAAGPNSFPDTVSFFILDPVVNLPLFSTSDPTGADALFKLDIDGTADGSLNVYNDPTGLVTWQVVACSPNPVPEPGTILLLAAGLLGIFFYRTNMSRFRQRAGSGRK